MGRIALAVVALWLAGCLEAGLSRCADGRICAVGFVCDDTAHVCIDPSTCLDKSDGDACGVRGACYQGACVDALCGNGRRERDEECDDGNLASHDGCSSGCLEEVQTWILLQPPTKAPARAATSIAYDALRARVVMFGGRGSGLLDDTWEWNGNDWIQRAPATAPPARWFHSISYDPVRARVVLFGGIDASGDVADTWEWDGTTWTQATPPSAPSSRAETVQAFDASTGRTLLFGGIHYANSSLVYYGDTWAWSQDRWMQIASTGPAPRSQATIASSMRSRNVLLYAGHNLSTELADTWRWTGTWTQIATPPPSGDWKAMAADEYRNVVVLLSDQTWEFRDDSWMMPQTAATPPLRARFGMVFDGVGNRVLVFGGQDPTTGQLNDETWSFRYERLGSPDESCVAGDDADHDGVSACADPDCWALCTPLCPPGATDCDPATPHCGDGVCSLDREMAVCPEDC